MTTATDRNRGTAQTRVRADEAPSEAVFRLIMEVKQAPESEILPLFHAINPIALDNLFQYADPDTIQLEVDLEYDDLLIKVSDELVTARRW
ncbi:HalOD1 output domain-containing protein [Halogeometricum luteum]|uniref:Halobacterial output domain-containing protein n=1 Tax=Halogeometricum luteum TaxID=2950537 RepID=A0ABU2G818_9EURY|nr:HalOD1 output domain-containing protein [Halogeometricum sp. S3BR5-2]MDS0296571.1 hypothetical protein [Halogeometricum sp. S3BR5-2]